jgi:PASTA domain
MRRDRAGWLVPALTAACGLLAGLAIAAALGLGGGATTRTVTHAAPPPPTSTGGTVVTITRIPDVIGARLDIAKQRVRRAGFDVNVEGGGTFGVIDETNWRVVSTDPPAGNRAERGSAVTLDIDR